MFMFPQPCRKSGTRRDPRLFQVALRLLFGGSANRLTEGKYSRCGTVYLENVPPVGQRGSVMICLFCDRKIRWWQKKAFSVVSANHYHWGCLWDAGRNNHKKRNDEISTIAAESLFVSNKTPHFYKIFLSPAWTFIKGYLFKLGFLDGRHGFTIAKYTARQSFLKYKKLHQLRKLQRKTGIQAAVNKNLTVSLLEK